MIRKKVCLLGAFAVGKTSLVRRFVHSIFSERYQTTVGVKIDKKLMSISVENSEPMDLTMVIWDVHGEDDFQKVRASHLRGSSGLLAVVDCTRPRTLETALDLCRRAEDVAGEIPSLLLLNKVDLQDRAELDIAEVAARSEGRYPVIPTSAKTGAMVEESFRQLADLVMEVNR